MATKDKDLWKSSTEKKDKSAANSLNNDVNEKGSGKKHMPCKNSLPT
ncbi:MAG TPA: hypothetical protein PKA28_12355 [Methylomusa anaerophila]|uniref:Uncharacterized protein n=1 Tax=Methylomusa anaerophila TaxID=1930071 RepID=A0A348AF82_9FIRM|nr:hypothetical protein [Methylomusa anaerophila]BBB89730.1 hypothetical protein MAMMFC1_00364 [Methylomusa anaerophila]HML89224.1 hypothetical protein [Methylomusa anaerophila]